VLQLHCIIGLSISCTFCKIFAFLEFQAKEAAIKKKLQQFLLEMFRMGTVRGFRHFSMYLRGKEEMGLTVYHEPQISSRRCSILQSTAPDNLCVSESLTSAQLPYDP
jgi:hypothetical protein